MYSSLAQSVEHSAVNRSVVGSSPTGGVGRKDARRAGSLTTERHFHKVKMLYFYIMAPWSSG